MIFALFQSFFTHHIVVASSPAESNFPVNIARFSPAFFLSLLLECCNVRARANFSAQACASLARSSAHFMPGTPCIARYLLWLSRDCFAKDPEGDDVAEAEGVGFSAKRNKASWIYYAICISQPMYWTRTCCTNLLFDWYFQINFGITLDSAFLTF